MDNNQLFNNTINKTINNEEKYKSLEKQKLKEVDEHLMGRSALSFADREKYGSMLKTHVDAQNDIAMENASRFQGKVKAESDKSKEERQEQYAEKRIKYGDHVTMETAAMERNIERYNKAWKKEQKKMNLKKVDDFKKAVDALDVSGNMFDITVIKGSKQHVDIKKILHTRDLVRAIMNEPNLVNLIDQLNSSQQAKLRAAMASQGIMEVATTALLKENGFDENGKLQENFNAVRKESGNSGITDLVREKEMLSHSEDMQKVVDQYKRSINRTLSNAGKSIEFTAEEQEMLKAGKTEAENKKVHAIKEKETEYSNLLNRIAADKSLSAGKLAGDCLAWNEELEKIKTEKVSYEILLKELEGKKKSSKTFMDKLRTKIMACEHSEEYTRALHQSNRLERMLRGVCENKPLTIAMQLELAEIYGFEEYDLQNDKKQENEVPIEELDDKKKIEMEKKSDQFQNYLGGRSISSLSDKEREENKEIIEFIRKYDSRRMAEIKILEDWLNSNAEMKKYKGMLQLDGEMVLDESEKSSALGKMATIGEYVGYAKPISGAVGSNVDKVSKAFDVMKLDKAANYIAEKKDTISAVLDKFSEAAGGIKDLATVAKFSNDLKKGKLSAETTVKTMTSVADGVRIGMKYAGASKDMINKMGASIAGINSLVDGISAQSKAIEAYNRQHNTKKQMEEFQKMKSSNQSIKSELDNLGHMLGSASETARLDKYNQGIHAAAGYADAIGSGLKYFGASAVVTGTISGVTMAANFVSDRYTASKKIGLRRIYLKDQMTKVLEQIRNSEGVKHLSERDIKHTLLKFMGAKSGKWSEAGIRKMAVDSNNLLKKDNNKSVNYLRAKARHAMGLGKDAKRSDVMKLLGANSSQAENPIKASNEIYQKKLERNKAFKPGVWKRIKNGFGAAVNWATRT